MKKQPILKCAALLMALCMMVTLAVGCGGKTDADTANTNKTTAATTGAKNDNTDDENDPTSPSKSNSSKSNKQSQSRTARSSKTKAPTNIVDGTNVKINGTVTVAGMDNCYFALNASKNEWNNQIRTKLSAVEKSLNCKFKLTKYSSSDLTTNAIKADRAGSKFADLMVTTLWQQKSLIAAKALQDLNSVKGLDLTKPYWDQASRREAQLYGKNFIAYTSLDGTGANANVIYFNKTLAKQVGTSADKLYKMVNDGTWTFKVMQDLSNKAAKDLDGNGMDKDKGTDQYGFTGVDIRGGVAYSIFKAQGGYFTKTSSSGDVTYALNDAKNIAALSGMQRWLLKDSSVFNTDRKGNNHEIGWKTFHAGRVLFLGWSADSATNFTTMKDDWGILPYPKAEAGGKYISVISWNTQGFSIPRKVKGKDLQHAALAMDAIAKEFHTIRENKRAYMGKMVYRDKQTQKMLDIAEESASIDFCQFGDLGAGGLSTIHYLFDNVSNDAATRVKSVKEEATSHLNTFLKAVK